MKIFRKFIFCEKWKWLKDLIFHEKKKLGQVLSLYNKYYNYMDWGAKVQLKYNVQTPFYVSNMKQHDMWHFKGWIFKKLIFYL